MAVEDRRSAQACVLEHRKFQPKIRSKPISRRQIFLPRMNNYRSLKRVRAQIVPNATKFGSNYRKRRLTER
jgi:hypothetical protein